MSSPMMTSTFVGVACKFPAASSATTNTDRTSLSANAVPVVASRSTLSSVDAASGETTPEAQPTHPFCFTAVDAAP